MTKRRAVSLFGLLLILVAGVAAALLLTNRRDVTTSSDEAYRVYREATENERRFYFKESRVGFARALELDPDFAMAMLGMARMSEKEQAISLVRRARKLKGKVTDREQRHIDLAEAMLEKSPEEGQKIALEILKRYPDDFRATTTVAMYEASKGRAEEAVRVFTRLLEVDPNSADAYNMIGYHYGYRGDYEKAIENLRKYQFMAPDQANPHDSIGEIQAYSGHYDEAIANLDHALKIKPDFFAAYDHLGVAYEGKGEYAKAFQSYLKGSEVIPKEGQAEYLYRALRAAYLAGDLAAARSLLPKFEQVEKNEHTEFARPLVSAVYDLLEGRPADAEKRLAEMKPRADEHLREMNKNRPDYKVYWADWNWIMVRAKLAQGKDAEAVPLLQEMVAPPNGWQRFEGRLRVYEARAQLAALLAKRGELDQAEKLLEENRKWNPTWAPTRPAEQTVAQVAREKVLGSAK